MSKLVIKDLYASVEGKQIINGLNLEIGSNEIHVIMGPNGTGKSTLTQVIMGHPKYTVDSGEILVDGENILDKSVDQRAKFGLFLSMQYPAEIPGITNSDFLRSATSELGGSESLIRFVRRLESNIDDLHMNKDMINRYLNEGFSGGEKKKNEILQMAMINPKFAILDEIDSGLDIDALNVVGNSLTKQMEASDDLSLVLITHYQRLLDYIKPTHIHVMIDGKIVDTGDYTLAKKLEETGYDEYKKKYGKEEEKNTIGACATAMGVNNAKK